MTREDEIRQAAFERDGDGDFDSNDGLSGFIEGAEWADQHPQSPWISVENRLPEQDEVVLVVLDTTEVCIARYKDVGIWEWFSQDSGWCTIFDEVTHWMPIHELTTK